MNNLMISTLGLFVYIGIFYFTINDFFEKRKNGKKPFWMSPIVLIFMWPLILIFIVAGIGIIAGFIGMFYSAIFN